MVLWQHFTRDQPVCSLRKGWLKSELTCEGTPGIAGWWEVEGMAGEAQQARGTSSSVHRGECEPRAYVCMLVCVLNLSGPVRLHCVSGCARYTALLVHWKTPREGGQEDGRGQNLSSTPSTFRIILLHSSLSHPLYKVSLGSCICPHKKQKSADVA